MAPRPIRRKAMHRIRTAVIAGLGGFCLVRTIVRPPDARPVGSVLAPPIIQRAIVPSLHHALQGVVDEGSRHGSIGVLDCGDARWATALPGGVETVAVDGVVCIDTVGVAPEDGAESTHSSAYPPPPLTIPWLRSKSVRHVPNVPHGGSSVVATTVTSVGSVAGRKASPRTMNRGTSSIPRTILALTNADGHNVQVEYLLHMVASAASSGGTRLVLLDVGNMPVSGEDPAQAKPPAKPRPPGFQVFDYAAPMEKRFSRRVPRHRFYSLAMNTVQPAFAKVYDTRAWGTDGGGSGIGSSLAATASLRASLADLIDRYKIKSFLDSSCGSMHWMPLVVRAAHGADPDFRYTGTDAVCSLVEGHRRTFAEDSAWMNFACVDASHEPLPSGYDLVFSRDSLQHLPIASAYKFLHNVRASGAKYLLVGSYVTGGRHLKGGLNVDIGVGDVYDINLLKPPFNLRPAPLEVIKEDNPEQKFMLLFDVSRMAWDEASSHLVWAA